MDLGLLLFAFAAGAAAFFAPCCVAMLPAYVGYAVRAPATTGNTRVTRTGRLLMFVGAVPLVVSLVPLTVTGMAGITPIPYELTRRLPSIDASLMLLLIGAVAIVLGLVLAGRARSALRGAAFGVLATLGFFAVFLTIGLPIAFLARGLAAYLPALAVLVGLGLVTLGGLMLAGKHVSPSLPTIRMDAASPRGFFVFGLGYGIASLSCTFPIFLGVLAAGLVAGGLTSALLVFAAYALGKGILLVSVTALVVAGGAPARARLGRAAPAITKLAAWLLIVTGGYIAYYYGRFLPMLGGA